MHYLTYAALLMCTNAAARTPVRSPGAHKYGSHAGW